MVLYIKYMVSLRCKLRVREELDKLEIDYVSIDFGMIRLRKPLGEEARGLLGNSLKGSGLELMEDRKAILIEKIKNLVIHSIRHSEDMLNLNFSDMLSQALDYEYNYLSNKFSRTMGITIGQYVIAQKIEMAKEYLLYDEMNLSEIARMLRYSSVGHLSRQFKDVTGLTPSYFKRMRGFRLRIALEDI